VSRLSKSPFRDAAPGAARELTRRRDAALDDGGDLIEGDAEDVVEDEGDGLRGRECVEHDQEREPDRVGEQQLLFWVGCGPGTGGRLGKVSVGRSLGP